MLTPTLYVHSPSLYHPPTFFLHCVFFCRYLIFNHIFIVLVNPRPTHTTLYTARSFFKHFLSQMGFKWKSMIHSTSCPTPGSKAQSICKIISQRSHNYRGSHSRAQNKTKALFWKVGQTPGKCIKIYSQKGLFRVNFRPKMCTKC